MIEMMIIALICGIVITVLAGKQRYKTNWNHEKDCEKFNKERELRDINNNI